MWRTVLRTFGASLAGQVTALVLALGAVSGLVASVDWACRQFGTVPVLVATGVVAGSVVTTAYHRAAAEARRRDRGGVGRAAPGG
jgi:hypothetical protein